MFNVNDSETGATGGPDSEHDRKPLWKRKTVWIAAGVAVVLVAVAACGGVVWSSHARASAQQDCRRQVDAIRGMDRAPVDRTVAGALRVGRGDVADAGSWQNLQANEKGMLRLKRGPMPGCGAASRKAAQAQDRTAADRLEALKQARKKLDGSARAVLASRDAKALKDACGALASKVAQAKALLGSSAGNVADDTTRTALSQQLDGANRLLADRKAKTADLQKASKDLDDAMNAVNASVQAKQDADARSAQAAAQSQAVHQAPVPSSSGYSGSRYGGGGSGYAPARQQQNVPVPSSSAPSVPAQNGGASDWQSWLNRPVDPHYQACNASGVCGIG